MKLIRAGLAALLLASPAVVCASERIIAYDSDIEVRADAGMTVTETIRVRTEGNRIKRGIYRDFPTLYRDRLGNRYRVGFEIIAVERDGRPEPYHTARLSNGVRIYIGEKSVFLRPGEYTYAVTYRTNRQLGFFPQHDELYWNVTGNGWDFPIEHAGASVRLPTSIPPATFGLSAYTGPFGALGQDYHAQVRPDGSAYFETARTLAPHEGLTIVVQWPKGYIAAPTVDNELGYLLSDNRELAALGLGTAALLIYYFLTWLSIGRDPRSGVIVPQYVPPAGFSPASMRFVRRMGYDHKTFAAALVNLAVKGYLRIDQNGAKYTLQKTGKNGVQMAPGEQALVNKLFDGRGTIALESSNHATIRAAIDAHKNSLKRNYEKIYFLTNSRYLLPGILISLAALIAGAVALPDAGARVFVAVFMTVWLSVWTIVVVALLGAAIQAWRGLSANGLGQALSASLFAGVFTFFEGVGLWVFVQATSVSVAAAVIALVLINLAFYQWLKAPTLAGRKLLDRIDGFRSYLSVAEGQELKGKGLPRETLDLFEIYLPYALALDVEQRWSERFADVFSQMQRDRAQPYQPTWYQHPQGYGRFPDMASALGGALGSAISASSHAPGSSSGGGGGSSGGGGGGGGGGGW